MLHHWNFPLPSRFADVLQGIIAGTVFLACVAFSLRGRSLPWSNIAVGKPGMASSASSGPKNQQPKAVTTRPMGIHKLERSSVAFAELSFYCTALISVARSWGKLYLMLCSLNFCCSIEG